MLLRSLLTAGLLLSLGACAKKDPAPATVFNTGSYKLDGRLVSCQNVFATLASNRANMGADELQIQLITPATDQSPSHNMMLSFVKNTGSPVSDYLFMGVTHITGLGGNTPIQTRSYRENRQFTLTTTASGGYSGTFSCTSPGAGTLSASEFTEGVFTDVRP